MWKQLLGALSGVVFLLGCNGGDLWPGPDSSADGDTDVDVDGDSDTDGDADTETGTDADIEEADADVEEEPPPPICEPVTGSGITISTDPSAPWDGGSARVRVSGDVPLTNVQLAVEGDEPVPVPSWIEVVGDGPWTWSWSLSSLRTGSYCLTFSADPDSRVYQRAPLLVTGEAPPVAPFTVVENHQWTCEEEYTWAINVDTIVLDEVGVPIPGVRILVEHEPCETAEDHPPPSELITDDDGFARWENYNPRCFFHQRIAESPSDTAIEIYSGIWEDQEGCNYCSTFAVNVWGHWSYTITFQRTPGAGEICEVPTDHAGQSRCAPTLHWEEPSEPCRPL